MAAQYTDNFNRADSTSIGSDWTERANDLAIASNHLNNNDTNKAGHVAELTGYTVATGDYEVQADVFAKNVANNLSSIGVVGRYTDTTHFYHARINYSSGVGGQLYIFNGSATLLGSYNNSPALGTTYTVKLQMVGSTIKLFIDGTERISVTNSTLTTKGSAGVRIFSDNTGSVNIDDAQVDNFSVTNYPSVDLNDSITVSESVSVSIVTPGGTTLSVSKSESITVSESIGRINILNVTGDDIDQSFLTAFDGYTFDGLGVLRVAQSFTTTYASSLTKVRFRIIKEGTGAGDLRAELYTNNSGVPGSLIATADADIPPGSIPATYTDLEWTFTNTLPLLAASTKYFIVLRPMSAGDSELGNDYGILGYTWNSGTYANGEALIDYGGWNVPDSTPTFNTDFYFMEFARTAVEHITVSESVNVTLVNNVNTSETIIVREPSRYAITVNGTNQYATFTAPFTRTTGQPFTAIAWYKTSGNNSSHRVIVGVRNGSSTGDLWKLELNNNLPHFEYDPVASVGGSIDGAATKNDGNIHMIMGTYDGSTITLYTDGVVDGTPLTGKTNASIDQTLGAIGARADLLSQELFVGDVGPIYVFTRALTSQEALDHWNGKDLDTTNLQIEWPFWEGTGTKVTDVSGNNVTATLVNSPTWISGFGDTIQPPTLVHNPTVSDSITVSESISISITGSSALSVNVSDSISVSDVDGQQMISFVNVNDSITVTDVDGQTLVHNKSVSDNVTVTENIGVVLVSFINKSESITITENVQTQEVSFVNVNDNVSVTDIDGQQMISFVTVNDNITVTDVDAQTLVHNVATSDSITVTDVDAQTLTFNVATSDTITVQDIVRYWQDTVYVFESINICLVNNINVNDSITVSESTNLLQSNPGILSLSVSENITISENVGIYVWKVGTQINPVADAYTRSGIYADTNFGTDTQLIIKNDSGDFSRKSWFKYDLSAYKGALINKAFFTLKVAAIQQVQAKVVGMLAQVSDDTWTETGITWNNAPTIGSDISSLQIDYTEYLYAWDVTSYAQNVLDEVSGNLLSTALYSVNSGANVLTNPYAREQGGNQAPYLYLDLTLQINISDSIAVSENVNELLTSFVNKSENITVTDVDAQTLAHNVNVSENINVSENLSYLMTSFINEQENILVSENFIVNNGQVTIQTLDNITVSENINVFIPYHGAVASESISVTESIQLQMISFVNKTENISVTDVDGQTLVNLVGVSDNVSVTDIDNQNLVSIVIEQENITVTESTQFQVINYVNETENITVTENIQLNPVLYVIKQENITVSENVQTQMISFINKNENITISESVGRTLAFNISVIDYIYVLDHRDNLHTNPSVETDLSNFVGGAFSGALDGSYSRSTTRSMFGGASLKFNSASSKNIAARINVNVFPGKTYTFSAYIYREPGYSGNSTIDIFEYTSGASPVFDGPNVGPVGGDGQWERVTVTQTMRATTAVVQLRFVNDGNSVGTAYIDGMQFEVGDTATPYFDGSNSDAQWNGTAQSSTSSTSYQNIKLLETSFVNEQENVSVTESYTVKYTTLEINVSDTITISEYIRKTPVAPPLGVDVDHGVGETTKIIDVEIKGNDLLRNVKIVDEVSKNIVNTKIISQSNKIVKTKITRDGRIEVINVKITQ